LANVHLFLGFLLVCDQESPAPVSHSFPVIQRSFHVRVVAGFLVGLARFYQMAISPHLMGSCKFVPSCSRYFISAVERHGPWRGFLIGIKRVLRCHPFSQGGIDPVPD
jgi:hypothetical protein